MNLGCTRPYMSSKHFLPMGKFMAAEGYGLTELNKENWLVWVPERRTFTYQKDLPNTLILLVYNSIKISQDPHTCTSLQATTASERRSILHWQALSFIWIGSSCEERNTSDLQILSFDGDCFKLPPSAQK